MNECIFFGKIFEEIFIEDKNGVSVIQFRLQIQKHRKSKSNSKHIDTSYLNFEAWDTGAQTIYDMYEIGDSLLVKSSARSFGDKVVFRINEFKIIQGLQDIE